MRVRDRTTALAIVNADVRSKIERAERAERELKESRGDRLFILNELCLGAG
jgi:hypothetical protein